MSPSVIDVLKFLSSLRSSGLNYSGLNTVRSALSTLIQVDGVGVGKHPWVIRFLKGTYNLKPPTPRYAEVWDVNIVLNLLKTMSPVRGLTLKDLTLKLVMLLSIVTAQRGQVFHLLDLEHMQQGKASYTFTFPEPLKTSKPNAKTKAILRLKAYAPDRRLCIVTTMKEYIRRTEPIREKVTRLLISYHRPHGPISRDTLARWVRIVMSRAGINDKFAPHSCRTAAASAAKRMNIPVDVIMDKVGWASAKTFAKYYDKPITPTAQSGSVILA